MEGKNDLTLTADIFTAPHFIKSRRVDIYNEKSDIYNNVIYPKTGSNLPCLVWISWVSLKKKLS